MKVISHLNRATAFSSISHLGKQRKELIKYKAKNGTKLKEKTGVEEEEGVFFFKNDLMY